MGPGDAGLLLLTTVVVIADIVLALCLRFILPDYMTQEGCYPVGKVARFEDAVKICPCLSNVYPKGRGSQIIFTDTKKKRQIDQRMQQINSYPFLVSLSIPAYSDDTEEKLFVCNGLIQSSDSLVTTKTCLNDKIEWKNLSVRSGSAYWSQFGNEHSVLNVSYINKDLVELKVSPKFPQDVVANSPIKYPFDGDWIRAFTLGWDDDIYAKNSKFRFKYKIFDVEEWTSRNQCNSTSISMCYNSKRCKRMSSKPLVTSCHQLIGVQMFDGGNCNEFSSLRQQKDCHQVYRRTCQLPDVDICEEI